MSKSKWAVLIVCFLAVPMLAAPGDPVVYPISHRNTPGGTLPGINVSSGQTIDFHILNTNRNCFTYNAKELKEADLNKALMARDVEDETVFDLPVVHDEETAAYEIDVVRIPDAEIGDSDAITECQALKLPDRTWTIPVRTYWRFAMSGAITGDSLTKPNYFLEPATIADPKDKTKTVDGFYVRKNGAGQDRIRFGMAAMAHLFHPSPGKFGVSWAPISFGLGLQDNEVQYFLGTTLRFGTRAFITGGVTVGPRDRLPNNLTVGKFTAESTALDTLPKKTSQGIFISIGFSFLEANAGKLTGLIAKP